MKGSFKNTMKYVKCYTIVSNEMMSCKNYCNSPVIWTSVSSQDAEITRLLSTTDCMSHPKFVMRFNCHGNSIKTWTLKM